MPQKTSGKDKPPRWEVPTSAISWFRAPDQDLRGVSDSDKELAYTAPLIYWRKFYPKHVPKATAERFLDALGELAEVAPLKDLKRLPRGARSKDFETGGTLEGWKHEGLPDALNYFIQSTFYFLLGEKSSFDEGHKLLYKKDAAYWRDVHKNLDLARRDLKNIGPIFNQLTDLEAFSENLPNGRKAYDSGWVVSSKAAMSLEQICNAIDESGLRKPGASLPINNAGRALKLKIKRIGRPRDQRFEETFFRWASALEKAFGKPQHKLLAKLFSAALGSDFTRDSIRLRLPPAKPPRN